MANIKQVAAAAGLSVACVSKYLKSPDSVLPTTRQRIEEAIEALHYVPSAAARSLRTKKSYQVKIVMESISNPFFADMFEGLRRQLEAYGYTSLLQNMDKPPAPEDFRGLDGLIVCFGDDETRIRALLDMAGASLPTVCLHWRRPSFDVPAVWVDVSTGMELAVEHLLAQDCDRFAYVGGPASSIISSVKYQGTVAALTAAGKALTPEGIYHGEFTFQAGYDAAKAIARLPERPQAVVCENDVLAAGVICGLYRQGVAVPEEVRVTGFDNLPLAEMYIPAITSIAIPMQEMHSRAVAMLLERINGEVTEDCMLAPLLIPRQS
ncbi:MAG: LacI family DNA-binding transcriptional regulator [Clostridia bacterium]|nr:LacI family DNA-binding transcriptional regulator [Clostridia bacterium]